MRRTYLFALLLASCKEEPPQPAYCTGAPDFEILVTALGVPLPTDTVVRVTYGGEQVEEKTIYDRGGQAVFCDPSDREGNLLGAGGQGGQAGAGATGLVPQAGAGGEPSGDSIEGLVCTLWTDGPATVRVRSSFFPAEEVKLSAKRGKCTAWKEIQIGRDDGGA